MTVGEAFTHWVVPALGGVIAIVMFSSPIKSVLRARRERVLGELNPLPFPAICGNCAGWVGYSMVTQDVMVYWPNQVGLLIGIFLTLSCYGLADTKTKDRQLAIFLFFAAVVSLVGGIGALVDMSYNQRKLMWGFTCNAILLMYYAAPLSTIAAVIRTRSSASLHLPLSVMNTINGALWVVYGAAVRDLFIAVPNGIGAVMGLVLIALIFIFPARKSRSSPAASDSDAGTANSQQPLQQHRHQDAAAAAAARSGNGCGSDGQDPEAALACGGSSLKLSLHEGSKGASSLFQDREASPEDR